MPPKKPSKKSPQPEWDTNGRRVFRGSSGKKLPHRRVAHLPGLGVTDPSELRGGITFVDRHGNVEEY